MSVSCFSDLNAHAGHSIEITQYVNKETGEVVNVAIECMDCYEVLLDFDNDIDGLRTL